MAAVEELSAAKTRRQVLKEELFDARIRRDYELSAALEQQLDLLTELRADTTQDEGAYDPYLDKDDWYERDRRRAMGLDKR